MTTNNRMATTIRGTMLIFTAPTGERVELDHSKLDGAIRDQLMVHGLRQKIADAAAMKAGTTWSEKIANMQGVIDALLDGEFTRQRASAGTLLAQVLSVEKAKPLDVVKAYLQGLTPAQVRGLEAHYADKIAALRKASAAPVDVDDLLEGLDDM